MSDLLPIPRRPTDVTGEWLSAALSSCGAPTQVSDVVLAAVGTGQTGATYRIAASYAANPLGMPDTFVLKLPVADDDVRSGVTLGYLSEVAFYARVADKMAVPTPRCFYSDIADGGADFALLLEDMSPAAQGDQIVGSTPVQARVAVTALAGLHGPSWCDPAWLDLAEVAMPMPGNREAAQGLGDVARIAVDMTCDKLPVNTSGLKVPSSTPSRGWQPSMMLINVPPRRRPIAVLLGSVPARIRHTDDHKIN